MLTFINAFFDFEAIRVKYIQTFTNLREKNKPCNPSKEQLQEIEKYKCERTFYVNPIVQILNLIFATSI